MGRIVCRYRNVFIDIYIDLVSLFFFVVDVVKFAYVDWFLKNNIFALNYLQT